MQFSTLLSVLAVGIPAVVADFCGQAQEPRGRDASNGFVFSRDANDASKWKWESRTRDLPVVTTINQDCQVHQGGGGGDAYAATICIDFSGNYACWTTPPKNQVCDLVFEQNEAPLNVCGDIKNVWGWTP
ncbi:hypothetical protein CkaCkLH20_07323 [Colletotrichum karsti]|uniref:Uncharacterized protein n=1 Tax=Colletotrichum karsti TaxID=1095194 RepID=A0A9P6LJY1_9PEZI|nr:uncharacterized protein CkaCkLH20_07323 [Colletotrichum karsti]KAF9875057.1 hypothetical protein CkaCkLH20_07323 [Colletotrichum karsti]